MKDLMFATVAMQERHNRRIEGAVAALEEIKRQRRADHEVHRAHAGGVPDDLRAQRDPPGYKELGVLA